MTSDARARQEGLRTLGRCEAILARHALSEHGELRRRLDALRRLCERGRLVRVALVGRRGSGKSSLVNAVAGAPVAPVGDVSDATGSAARYVLDDADTGRAVEWIDTPGLRAGGRATRRDAVQAVLRETPCDVLLAPVTATEVDAGIDEDLDDLRAILNAQERVWDYRPKVIAVVTRADDLAPADVIDPPFDDEKRANIQLAVSVLHRHMLRAGVTPVSVIPVVAVIEWEGARARDDRRWNLGPLMNRLRATLPLAGASLTARRVAEFERTLRECGERMVDGFAQRARGLGSRERLAELHTDMVDALDALLGVARDEAAGANVTEALGTVLHPGGLLEAVRAGAAGVGARGLGAAVAAARVRALGGAVLTMERAALDHARVRALVTP